MREHVVSFLRPPFTMPILRALATLALLGVLASCTKEEVPSPPLSLRSPVLPDIPFIYTLPTLPDHFNTTALLAFESTPADNPITDAGATLGRVLFYDRNLSANFTTSCGSCHHQEQGFADVHPSSRGHTGDLTRRNAPHLVNQFYLRRQFWDQRAPTLEAQVLMPIQDPLEMGMVLGPAIDRVKQIDYYPALFTAAFGNDSITPERISRSLAQFVRSLASYRTRYDEGEADGFSQFTAQELAGKALFFNSASRCNQCHMTANFFSPTSFNNGLDVAYTDNGLGEITGDPADNGKFKVPSLRNVERTAPYMHDGRFNTLEEVVEHYNSGLQPHPNLDDRLTSDGIVGGTPYQLGLTTQQKQALVAFLRTLTDVPLLNDPRFADPFEP